MPGERQSSITDFARDSEREGEENEECICPTCGRSDFTSERGMRQHHALAHDESLSVETLTCNWCGDTYDHRKDRTEESRFCSQECRNEWQTEKRYVFDCKVCGETVELPPSRDYRQFCSRDCADEHHSETMRGQDHPNWNGGYVSLDCERCGEDYLVQQNRAEDGRFCSHDCLNEWQSEGRSGERSHNWQGGDIEKECDWCGDKFTAQRSREDERRFCSNECYGNWRSENIVGENHPDWKGGEITKECEWCGDEYEARQYRANERRFCGQMCYAAWKSENESGQDSPLWKGGKNVTDAVRKQLHGENWHLISQRLREGAECRMCGTTEELQVHHIIPVLAGGLNGDWNLMVLCAACHHRAEWYTRDHVDRVLIPEG